MQANGPLMAWSAHRPSVRGREGQRRQASITFPASLNTSLTDGSNPDVYPITGTTYALVYEHQTSKAIAAGLINFFSWVLSTGQDMNVSLYYAPLGADLQKLAVAQLTKITINGKPVA